MKTFSQNGVSLWHHFPAEEKNMLVTLALPSWKEAFRWILTDFASFGVGKDLSFPSLF